MCNLNFIIEIYEIYFSAIRNVYRIPKDIITSLNLCTISKNREDGDYIFFSDVNALNRLKISCTIKYCYVSIIFVAICKITTIILINI